ncbi:interleukin 12 receptor, beta 2a, like isoform X2 [Pygocentrus nattereri]|uniref:Fibronectin type-III domain-containing protein n=1 Tax=Pygocentrus nattereri TaxID=42514 RepID=A0A3B4D4M2_PYGNA|nr:interleukin 12 receptor, beta 2a, like isoform X2 [Pygocentrus nattereri]
MAWHSGALVLPVFTLCLFAWLCPYASLGQDVRCWWNRGISVSRNVSIECHAEPPRFPQKCDRCQLRLSAAENSTLAVPHRCTHNAANFTALLSPQALQNISCELLCGQANKTCAIQEGYPPPICLIPLYDGNQNIHCRWTSLYNILNPNNFTLHWEEEEVDETWNHDSRVMGNSDYGTIQRVKYTRSFHFRVWVSAVSALATVESEAETFNTDDIEEPLSPLITNHTCDPFEIFWSVEDDVNEASSQQRICEVQYMNECDMDWTEVEGTYDLSFTLDHPVPFLTYMFRVRCGFLGERIIMSNWSLYTTRTPAGDLAKPEILLNVTGGSQFLNVSWSVPSQSIEHIQEYVVQYKPVGLPCTHSQNWVKVNITQNWVTLRGQFWKYTAYNVSLLAVINKCMHLVQSATVYTVQEVPPKVTDIRVTDISASSAILTWKPLPLDNSQRVILNYLVAVSNHTVLNVSSDKNSILLTELNPGQQYKVWISAVTSGGQGEKTTTLFATRSATDISDYTVTVVVVTVVLCLILLIIMIFVFINCYTSWLQGKVWLKIPDPMNSSLFQQRNNQFRQSWLVPHNPSEHALTISPVDEVLISDKPLDPEAELIVEFPEVEQQQTQPEEDREYGEEGEKELQGPGRLDRNDSMTLQRANEYRQVIDSSEEEVSRENDDDDWDELPSPSDYEKHFLPSVQDM